MHRPHAYVGSLAHGQGYFSMRNCLQ